MTIRIVTDSTSDLPEDVVAEYGIAVVPLYINIDDQSFLDGIELSRAAFYDGLPDYESVPTTSAPGPGMFVQTYERLAEEGATQILSIHISSLLSSTVNSARLGKEGTDRIPVTVWDGGQLTLGTGLLILEAARAAAAGRSMDEIMGMLQEKAARTHSFAALDTLEFLHRSGRVGHLVFGLGTLLRIKPLLKMYMGQVEMERVRTRRKAVQRLIELVEDLGPLEHLALVHTHAPERVEALRPRIQHLIPGKESPLCAEVTPVIGAHVGPNAVGLVAMARG